MTKPKPARSRPGAIFVELRPDERAKLERLRDQKLVKSVLRWSLSDVVRNLIAQATIKSGHQGRHKKGV